MYGHVNLGVFPMIFLFCFVLLCVSAFVSFCYLFIPHIPLPYYIFLNACLVLVLLFCFVLFLYFCFSYSPIVTITPDFIHFYLIFFIHCLAL